MHSAYTPTGIPKIVFPTVPWTKHRPSFWGSPVGWMHQAGCARARPASPPINGILRYCALPSVWAAAQRVGENSAVEEEGKDREERGGNCQYAVLSPSLSPSPSLQPFSPPSLPPTAAAGPEVVHDVCTKPAN